MAFLFSLQRKLLGLAFPSSFTSLLESTSFGYKLNVKNEKKKKKQKTIKLKVLGDILLTSFVIVRHALHALTAWLL